MTIEPNKVTALIGSSGCGKTTFLRSLNRMHELTAGAPGRGRDHPRRRGHLRPAASTRSQVRRLVGMVFQSAEPVPDDVDLRQRRRRPQPQRAARSRRPRRTRSSSAALRGAHLWDEVKDRLDKPGLRPLRRPAAAALHRPRDRGRARGAADGRALLGARPGRDAGDRGPDRRAEEPLHDRDRHPQHAAGGAGQRRHRLLQPRGDRQAGAPGRDRRRPRRSSPSPTEQATEDYVSGRFG